MLPPGPRLPGLLAASLVLGCSGAGSDVLPAAPTGAKPKPTPTLTASATASATPTVAPVAATDWWDATSSEPDSPTGFTTHESAGLPAPEARGAKEDLTRGTTCRIGSARLTMSREYGELVFASQDRLSMEGLGDWMVADAASGAKLEDFKLGGPTVGLSPSGTCAAVRKSMTEVVYYKLPSRKAVATRTYSESDSDHLLPADDCAAGMHQEDYSSACVGLLSSTLDLDGKLCVGKQLGASAMSGDGKRIALAPSQMDEKTYQGDGVHVFDTASREEVTFVKRNNAFVSRAALSRNGGALAFVDGQDVRIVGLPSGGAVSTFPLPDKTRPDRLLFSPSARRLAVSFQEPGNDMLSGVAVLDVKTGKALFVHRRLPWVGAIAFSPEGDRLAYVVKVGVRIVDAFTGEERAAPGRLFHVSGAVLTGGGDRAVVSSPDHLTIWDTKDCSRVADFPSDTPLSDLMAPPDGSAVIGFAHGSIARVDLKSGTRKTLEPKNVRTRDSEAMTPDGKHLLLGVEDEQHRMQVVVIDAATLTEVRRVPLPKVGPIGAFLFTPGGKSVFVAAPGGLENGDSPTGDTSVFEVDFLKGGLGKRFHLRGAAQSYNGAVLQKGRVVVVNDDWHEAATGKQLKPPSPERTLMSLSADQRTALWSDKKGCFLWPVDDPLPATPPSIFPFFPGPPSVTARVLLQWDGQSCTVAHAAAAGGRSPDPARTESP